MNITARNILAHELIGIEAEIVESEDPTLKFSGKIVYETKNMLMFLVKNEMKMISKKAVKLMLTLPDSTRCLVDGVDLLGRPEDRIQRLAYHG
ncbi:MAG: ribonuclease P protein subunit [Nitrososphaerales archaeon]